MEELKTWLEEHLEYVPPADLNTSDIASILYKGDLKASLQYLVRHVKSKQMVETIRGNVRVHEAQQRQDKVDCLQDEDDDFEEKSLKKALKKAKMTNATLDHDIKRSQAICQELNTSVCEMKAKLVNTTQKSRYLSRMYDNYSCFIREVDKEVQNLTEWSSTANRVDVDRNGEEVVQKIADEMKLMLFQILLDPTKMPGDRRQQEVEGLKGLTTESIVRGLLGHARTLNIKVQNQLDQKANTLGQSADEAVKNKDKHLDQTLQDLWQAHLNSFLEFQTASKQLEAFEAEISRIDSENDTAENKGEMFSRLLKLRRLQKSGQAMLNHLKKEVKKLQSDSVGAKDIGEKYILVEQQSKAMMAKKLVVEELLSQTLGNRERVSNCVQQIQQRKTDLNHAYGQSLIAKLNGNQGLPAKAIQHHVTTLICETTLDRPSVLLNLNMSFKPNVCHLLRVLTEDKLKFSLHGIYSDEMSNLMLKKSMSNLEILDQLLKANERERSELAALIKTKLGTRGKLDTQAVNHSVQIWSKEPAKDVFIKDLDPCFEGKPLSKWYEEFKRRKS